MEKKSDTHNKYAAISAGRGGRNRTEAKPSNAQIVNPTQGRIVEKQLTSSRRAAVRQSSIRSEVKEFQGSVEFSYIRWSWETRQLASFC